MKTRAQIFKFKNGRSSLKIGLEISRSDCGPWETVVKLGPHMGDVVLDNGTELGAGNYDHYYLKRNKLRIAKTSPRRESYKRKEMDTFCVVLEQVNQESFELKAPCKETAIDWAIENWHKEHRIPRVLEVTKKSKKVLKCIHCGSTEKVTVCEDPYAADLHGDHTEAPRCEECCKESAREI